VVNCFALRIDQPDEDNSSVAASLSRELIDAWTGRLAHYRYHRNDEHLRALLEEAVRYVGLHLENDLCRSSYWTRVRLNRKAAILLFLVDRGIVERTVRRGRRVFEPLPHAESWLSTQVPLRPYVKPIIELIAALRDELSRRAHSRNS
jgi:hypothetical protein